jgi:hypothetical protein
MFYSKKFNLLFIASPKTGTVSVHEALQKLDNSGSRRVIEIGKKVITGKDLNQGIIGHARAREIKEALGEKSYSSLNTMAFVRNPYSKLVSSYFFNRQNKLYQSFTIKGKKNRFKRRLRYFLSTLSAKLLPFKLWALVYPYRSNLSYLTDYDGSLIVKYIGRTEFLDKDFHFLLAQMDIDSKHIVIGKKNTSSHDLEESYFQERWFRNIITKKMKADINLYEEICKNLG